MKFRIGCYRTSVEHCTVEVEARSGAEAEAIIEDELLDMSIGNRRDCNWSEDRCEVGVRFTTLLEGA